MTIPDFQAIMLLFLKFSADDNLHNNNEAREELEKSGQKSQLVNKY